jgi:ABC-type multidrug transport system fused ATPase/permease subunit
MQYNMPEFISHFKEWFVHHQNLNGYTLAVALMFPFLLASVLLGLIARLINNYFEHSISKEEPAELIPELRRERELRLKKSLSFPVLLLLVVALSVLGLYFAQYLIST